MPWRLALSGLFLLPTMAHPQQMSPWQGEWGVFTGTGADQGRRLSIHDCTATTCLFSAESRVNGQHSDTLENTPLALQSDTVALATLPGGAGQPACVLHLKREAAATPVIQVEAAGSTCTSYYATGPEATFTGVYPLRSKDHYLGLHVDACFLGTSPALLATCTHQDVTDLERAWGSLAEQFPLHVVAVARQSAYGNEQALDAAILRGCDTTADPANCLRARYAAEIGEMRAKQKVYLDGTIERGDPVAGGKLARSVAGRYVHRFKNGDVQGDHYISTDTLTIEPSGPASIHFKADLNFYNGHTCSLSGGALFRRDGSFVFDDAPQNSPEPQMPACRLALIPGKDGIRFQDINGSCKSYCGERGSWNGAGFTFKERVSPRKTAARP